MSEKTFAFLEMNPILMSESYSSPNLQVTFNHVVYLLLDIFDRNESDLNMDG